jgi:hypothetical protein
MARSEAKAETGVHGGGDAHVRAVAGFGVVRPRSRGLSFPAGSAPMDPGSAPWPQPSCGKIDPGNSRAFSDTMTNHTRRVCT